MAQEGIKECFARIITRIITFITFILQFCK